MIPKGMIPIILFCVFVTVAPVAGAASAGACFGTSLEAPEPFAEACVRTAVERPSELAWVVLSKICELGASPGAEPRVCDWQTWATNDDTFPKAPREADPPEWPERVRPVAHRVDPAAPCGDSDKLRNRAAFDYIVSHRLWHRKGLEDAWKGEGFNIDFPANAVEVEASWTELGENHKEGTFHRKTVVTKDDVTVLCGLTGLDVKVKILPRWLWFTVEHVDNPGRCDYIGCRDDFGQSPAYVPPQPMTGQVYPPEDLTRALLALIPDLSEVWRQYRLKGTQLEFVDSDGRPTFLGNSHLEGPVIPASSSCITCHAQAGFDRQGMNLREHGFIGPLSVAAYGAPDPAWYYDTAPTGWELRYRQTDFNWAISLHVCPLTCPLTGPENPHQKPSPDRCDWKEICPGWSIP